MSEVVSRSEVETGVNVIAREAEEVFRSYRMGRFAAGAAMCAVAVYFGVVAPLLALYNVWDPLGLRRGLPDGVTQAGYAIVNLITLSFGVSVLMDALARQRAVLYGNGITPTSRSLVWRRGSGFFPFDKVTEVEFVHAGPNEYCNLRTKDHEVQAYLNTLHPRERAVQRLSALKDEVDARRSQTQTPEKQPGSVSSE